MHKTVCFLFVFSISIYAHGKTACTSIACVDDGGQVTFKGGFRQEMQALGASVRDGRVGSGGYIGGQGGGNTAGGLNNNSSGGNENPGGDTNTAGNANGGGENLGGNNGFGGNNGQGAGGQAAGFNDNSNPNLFSNNADTFEGFNNFDGSDEGRKDQDTLKVSPVLGEAIRKQGSGKKSILDDIGNNDRGRSNDPGARQLAAAYNGGLGGQNYGNSGNGNPSYSGAGADEGGNGIVEQAKNFFRGAFGQGGRKSGGRRGYRGNDRHSGKAGARRLAMHKTKSPEQVIKEKWLKMRRAGYRGRRGIASATPRGMLDAHTNIFHGMCKEYIVFASEIGTEDSGSCPPAR